MSPARGGPLALFFFGNHFYGVCAVALSAEAALQQHWPLNGVRYYALLFLATVVFYTHAYRHAPTAADERSQWYTANRNVLRATQVVCVAMILLLLGVALVHDTWDVVSLTWPHVLLALIFPGVALAYYGPGMAGVRRYGLLKPFFIGFVWAGVVTVLPVVFQSMAQGQPFPFTLFGVLLFVKNFMYITILCVLFDIKDQAADRRSALRTIVVRFGLRATLFRFVIPLTVLGLGSFLLYGSIHGFSAAKLMLNTIPFALLFAVALTLRRRRSMLYYHTVVDGLLLAKAVCGIAAMLWF